MQMVSNVNAQLMNAEMTAMRQEMVTLKAKVQVSRQVLVKAQRGCHISRPRPHSGRRQWHHSRKNGHPKYHLPLLRHTRTFPPAAAGALSGFPNFLGLPGVPQQHQHHRQGKGGRRQGNAGRGRGMSRQAMTFGQQPPPVGVQPQQGYQGTR